MFSLRNVQAASIPQFRFPVIPEETRRANGAIGTDDSPHFVVCVKKRKTRMSGKHQHEEKAASRK
jgi:hypothetical protein